ncbi:MAG: TIGR00304 family membrane protein, partial [Nitrososphaerales archaeon]
GLVRAMNSKLALLGVAIVFVGFLVVAIGTSTEPGGSSSSGGFVLIGPVPIVFGSGPNSGVLAMVGLVVTVVMVAVYLLSFLLWRSGRRREVGAEAE